MLEVFGQLLPAAMVIALSPFPMAGLIMIFFTKQARTNSVMFLLGWVAGLVGVTTIVLVLANAGRLVGGQDATEQGVKWGTLLLGLGLFVLAYRYWQKRPKAGESAETPKWMATLEDVQPRGALGLGAALSAINPKTLLLAIAGALTIANANLDSVETIVVTAAFILLSSVTIIGLVIYFRVAGAGADKKLMELKAWLIQNNAAIMVVILLVIGAKLVGDALGLF